MKRIVLLFYITIMVIFSGCKKENTSLTNQVQNPFFDSAVQFLKTQLSNDDFTKLDLASNEILRYRNKNIGVQIFEKETAHYKFLLLERASGNYAGNWVDMSDLKVTQSIYHSGSMTLQSLDREYNTKLIVENNEVIQIIKSRDNKSSSVLIKPHLKSSLPDGLAGLNKFSRNEVESPVLPEVIVYYDVNQGDYSYYSSLFWLFGQDSYYSDLYFQSSGGGGGGGASSGGNHANNVYAAPTFISPDKPIADLKKEVECFTNNNSSTYSISVNVNEPYPNSRDVFNPLSNFPVGHTFLTLEQHNSNGSIITRNVGFYPRNLVKPGASIDKSTFGDDTYTPFTVSLQFNVNGSDFNTVLNSLTNQQSYNYDLNNFNCTSSSIDALKSININLPDTKSADILFTGNNPADLGEDIRNLNLNNFSAANGNRQFIRSASNSNDKNSPVREGTCP